MENINPVANPFKPDYHYPSLADVPIEEFAALGIKGVLLDIDNTLVPYGQHEPIPEENRNWIDRAEAAGVKCILYSNATQKKIGKMERISGLDGVPKAYKPGWAQIGKALKLLGCSKEEALLIGDQGCTDILGGNFGGLMTLLVEPMTKKDWWGTKILRVIEMTFLWHRLPWNRKKEINWKILTPEGN
jgi:HAD superfamily phosphatase (TIGR01668 family)